MSQTSVDAAKAAIDEYRLSLPGKREQIVKRLAELGAGLATVTFTSAIYDVNIDGTPMNPANITVTVEGASAKGNTHYTIHADGKAVAFVEFGAGVFYNGLGGGKHPTRPPGIVGIGEYGKGKGKQQAWGFVGEDGEVYITRGTPEQPGMWLAAQTMRENVERIAREVFKT